MEGKTLILSVLIVTLVMLQIQVEAARIVCPNQVALNKYKACILAGYHPQPCAGIAGCRIENSDDAVSEYCKLGCVSSVCGALTNLKNSDTSEIVNGAVEKCTKTCSTLCTKGSMTALETA